MSTVRDAATVMLVRNAPDLQVFMLRRNLRSEWVAGAYVFPGGAVDPEDRSDESYARCPGRNDAAASALLGIDSGGLGFWVAAIRESFEEAGVLLARPQGDAALDLSDLESERAAVNRGDRRFLDVLTAQDLVLDVDRLHLFSHWITPAGMPRRYDTWFFVAEAPEGHAYLHDDGETVASTWISPADALERADAGELELIFPTRRSLEALTRFETASEVVAVVGDASDLPPATQPRIVADGNGARLLLPGDPGYDDAVEPADGSISGPALQAMRAVEREQGSA
ncbi:MAG: NUDIX hydrolase [Acidimicrobiia bacterium]